MLLLPLVQGWPTWGLILSHRQLILSFHIQATSQGHRHDLLLIWERKMRQQRHQRLTLPGCPQTEPHTGLALTLKGTVKFLGSHCYLPRGTCSQISYSPCLSKTCGMCFTASQIDGVCGEVKMVRHLCAISSSHQESCSRQAWSWSKSNEPKGRSHYHVPFLTQNNQQY